MGGDEELAVVSDPLLQEMEQSQLAQRREGCLGLVEQIEPARPDALLEQVEERLARASGRPGLLRSAPLGLGAVRVPVPIASVWAQEPSSKLSLNSCSSSRRLCSSRAMRWVNPEGVFSAKEGAQARSAAAE